MPITASFSVMQTTDCSKFKVVDTTPYSAPDGKDNFSARVINIYLADGSLYVSNFDFNFDDYPDDEVEFTGLVQDQAMTIVMTLTALVPVNDSVYEVSDVAALTCFSKVYVFERNNRMTIEPKLINSQPFIKDTMKMVIDIEAAKNAEADDDILSAQNALDRIKYIEDNDFNV